MKGQLVKIANDYYSLINVDGELIATTKDVENVLKLSIKNCQAIVNGYDLDELNIYKKSLYSGNGQQPLLAAALSKGFEEGFQKALEILGDKKFSEFLDTEKELGISDIKTIERVKWYYNTYFNNSQQTEWDVEIIVEKQCDCICHRISGTMHIKACCHPGHPMLDPNGCLILKRI